MHDTLNATRTKHNTQELESFTTAVVIRDNVEEADLKAEQLKLQQQVYMHVCTYVCMYVCVHACMHACMHACARTHIYIQGSLGTNDICVFVYTYVYI